MIDKYYTFIQTIEYSIYRANNKNKIINAVTTNRANKCNYNL